MAELQHTQTRPEFTWRFLSASERYPNAKPLVIYVNASSEQEARDSMPGVTSSLLPASHSMTFRLWRCAMYDIETLSREKATSRACQLATLLLVISDCEISGHERDNLIDLARDISGDIATFMLELDRKGGKDA